MIRNLVLVTLKPDADPRRIAELAPYAEQIARIQVELPDPGA